MPGGDRTGPEGVGPMTGKQLGYCAGNNRQRFMESNRGRGRGNTRGFGFGYGRGRGMGYGYRHGVTDFYSESMPQVAEKTLIENEIRILKDQLSFLEEQLSKTKEE
jgi:hypothetical protein